nr:acyltransferase family protein [Mammaliicoccus sp. Marseille-Q6498]
MSVENLKPNPNHNIRYLHGLDGLRAIAVIAIIIYHLNPKWLSGGFLGVDTFFIISGYLITSLLLHEFRVTGQIDLLNFWKKRLRRLLPAVLFLISVVLIYTLLFESEIIKNIKQDAIAALLYVSNWWYIFHEVSYFDSFKMMPLKHLWSLAIEEQFYIFWPIVLILLTKSQKLRQKAPLFVFIASIISVILMFIIAQPNADNSRVYFGTDTRLQTLLLGVLLAYLWPPFRLKNKINSTLKWSIEGIGFISLAILLLFIITVSSSDNWFYFGGIYIISFLTLPAIASSVHPSTLLSKSLGNPVFSWIGKRSYSLYLWHYPIITFLNGHFVQGQIPWYIIILEILLTFLFAEMSYRFVETPFRKYGLQLFIPQKRVYKSVIIRLCIVILLFGISLITISGHYDHLQKQEKTNHQTTFKVSGKDHNNKSLIEPIPKILVDKQAKKDNTHTKNPPLFIGDSVMVDIGKELNNTYPNAMIDGKVGRSLNDAIPLVQQKYSNFNNKNNKVVLELGTNGDFSYEDLNKLVSLFGKANVYLVNTHVPRDWEGNVNQKLRHFANRHKNVHLVDWYSKAKGHPEYFAYDGIHLEQQGVKALVSEINKHLK